MCPASAGRQRRCGAHRCVADMRRRLTAFKPLFIHDLLRRCGGVSRVAFTLAREGLFLSDTPDHPAPVTIHTGAGRNIRGDTAIIAGEVDRFPRLTIGQEIWLTAPSSTAREPPM